MDNQADQLVKNMEKYQSVSMETLDLAPSKPSKLFLKLKISKGQHICPVCSKGFSSGKALGGHIRIHMKGNKNGRHRKISKLHHHHHPRNIHRAKAKKRISGLPRAAAATAAAAADDDGADDDDVDELALKNIDHQQEVNNNNNNNTEEKAICCICNKDFRSMKSLFGHMRNHPERGWRGIRPPPSDKNSYCSSVFDENDVAMEVVDQISATEGSDLRKSLPKWNNTTAKRCGKFISDEIPVAALCLMKLSRGESFHVGAADKKPMIHKSRSSSFAYKDPEEKKGSNLDGKGKDRVTIELDQERAASDHCKRADSYWSEEKKREKSLAKELNYDDKKTIVREKKTKLNSGEDATNSKVFYQFQKFPLKIDEEEGDAAAMERRHRSGKKIGSSSQTPGFYPKNPSFWGLFGTPSNETASPAEGKHTDSKKQFPAKRVSHRAAEGSRQQVCSPKLLDFDLNEPYVGLDAEATGPY